ncbi:MAG: AMP-binding protein, partial [Planctomycetes bacterium]|nr:AMP-binding protein [Planctomycetota bacterium]
METTREIASPPSGDVCNIASHLPRMAAQVPDQSAVIIPSGRQADGQTVYTHLTFRALEELSNRYANGLIAAGIQRGMRTLLMVRPGKEFIGLVFAMFKVGAVPVMIDPGMGVKRLLECIRGVGPEALVGIPLAQLMRVIKRRAFATVRHVVTVGRRWCWGGPTLTQLAQRASPMFTPAATQSHETAAILFTSGSTGPAKGVVYEHGMFEAQVRAIRDQYGIEPGEIDLPTFPLFALFNPALGMASVIPEMDASHPARVDPKRIVEAIRQHGVTNTFGSPALWDRVSRYCEDQGIQLPSLRRILIAGAPVSGAVIVRMRKMLNAGADVHTPYGATESLPVASISGNELVDDCIEQSRRGAGICVGRPLAGVDLRIIRITDDPIEAWSDHLVVPDAERGEIVAAGDVVTKSYYGLPKADRLAKIPDGDRLWHRMGDVGYYDDTGRLWFCGRKAHRVTTADGTMFTIPCEAVFNQHPQVARSALVGVGAQGRQRPIIVIEPRAGRLPTGSAARRVTEQLLELGRANPLTTCIGDV